MLMRSINPEALAAVMSGDFSPSLLDVRLAEDFNTSHIADAINNCVFEIAFHERLLEALPDKKAPIVIYGAADSSEEARMAAEKLERHGYEDIAILEGGITGWKDSGQTVTKGDTIIPNPPEPDGRFDIDLSESKLQWTGRNLINKHLGTIEIQSGYLDFENGQLRGGRFDFNLNSLRCSDLEGDPMHDVLISHLMDHDFLDVAAYPECFLEITDTESSPIPGSPNLAVKANLTMRGKTCPIEFQATSGITDTGSPAAQASFAIDRTQWGILYGSGRFFQRLAGHLVNDLIEFEARILTQPKDQ